MGVPTGFVVVCLVGMRPLFIGGLLDPVLIGVLDSVAFAKVLIASRLWG